MYDLYGLFRSPTLRFLGLVQVFVYSRRLFSLLRSSPLRGGPLTSLSISQVNEYWGCFQCMDIINKTTKDIQVQVFVWMDLCLHFLWLLSRSGIVRFVFP